jgi:hypothetical protein
MIVDLGKIKCLKEFQFVPAKGKNIGVTLHLEGTESVIKEMIDSISIKDKKPTPKKPTKAEEKAKEDAEKLETLSKKSGPRFESEEDEDTERPDVSAQKEQVSLMASLGLPE